MNTNLLLPNKWHDYYYKLDNNLLSEDHIKSALTSLLKILAVISKESIILIQFKIRFENQFRSVSYLQTVKLSEFNELLEIFIEFWNLRNQDYLSLNSSHIVFTYKILNKDNGTINTTKLNRNKSITNNTNTFNFKGYNLPNTMDFTKWGSLLIHTDYCAVVKKANSNSIYHIQIFDDHLKVAIKIKDKILLEFKDTLIEKGKLDSFTRSIKNQEYIFIDGKLIVTKIVKETKFLGKILPAGFISDHFITMDLETRIIDGRMTPYCVSIYDGKNPISFYLTDYKNSDDMLKSSILYLMKPKYHNHKIYLHNFSFFDGIFLIKILSQLTKITLRPTIRDGRIIDLKFSFYILNNKINLYFRDSYLLLPSSLSKLATNFQVESKGIFPYGFVNNKDISLDYIGEIPAYEYFDKLSKENYIEYYNGFVRRDRRENKSWNLRDETIKYCEQDCITLHQIIAKFQQKIYLLFRIDILKYPALSSLAFAIYRSKFLKEFKIPLIDGDLFNQLKKAYSGGSVDVYKPTSNKGEKIYRYDVNSLYPYVMKQFMMPVGNPTFFEGDISKIGPGTGYDIIEKIYGFLEGRVTTPSMRSMKIPLLQTRLQIEGGFRTVAPLGSWTGSYFSEEIYNAMKYSYKFDIYRGYLFDKANVFKEYVDSLYELKQNSSKESPDYLIAKLLLNTLYGRFGMDPQIENHLILSDKESLKIQKHKVITNIIDLQNGKELISFFDKHDWSECAATDKKSLNISVSIAAAVTAYARIHMSQFKTRNDFTLFYTDTDSIDINKPLENKHIGDELGQMKLEHIFNEAVFLSPKVYGGVTDKYELVKVKGLKNPITFNELKPLLIKDNNIKVAQEKWYRDISEGNIKIKQEIYTLMINNKKRTLIYDNNKFVDTQPIVLDNLEIE